jgi:hypothetical protein
MKHVAVEALLRTFGRVDFAEIEKVVLPNKHGGGRGHGLNVPTPANEKVLVRTADAIEARVEIRRNVGNSSAANSRRQYSVEHSQIMQRG